MVQKIDETIVKNGETISKRWRCEQRRYESVYCATQASDLSKPLGLKTIAENLGLGYENFRVIFRRRAGMPPGQYRDGQRCRAACEKLIESHKPCWEIALYLSFCDERHFSCRFKQWTGLTPQAYRVKHRKYRK